MPIGAVLVSPDVSEVIYSQSNKLGMSRNPSIRASFIVIFNCLPDFLASGTFSHGFTYSGHPVSCAVAIEALKIYKYVPLSIICRIF